MTKNFLHLFNQGPLGKGPCQHSFCSQPCSGCIPFQDCPFCPSWTASICGCWNSASLLPDLVSWTPGTSPLSTDQSYNCVIAGEVALFLARLYKGRDLTCSCMCLIGQGLTIEEEGRREESSQPGSPLCAAWPITWCLIWLMHFAL